MRLKFGVVIYFYHTIGAMHLYFISRITAVLW